MSIIIKRLFNLSLFLFAITVIDCFGMGSGTTQDFPTPEEIGKMSREKFITQFSQCTRNSPYSKLWEDEYKRHQAEELAQIFKEEDEENEKADTNTTPAWATANLEFMGRAICMGISSKIQQDFDSSLLSALTQVLCEFVRNQYFSSDTKEETKKNNKKDINKIVRKKRKIRLIESLTKSK